MSKLREDETTLYFLRQEPYDTNGKLEVTILDMSLFIISMILKPPKIKSQFSSYFEQFLYLTLNVYLLFHRHK